MLVFLPYVLIHIMHNNDYYLGLVRLDNKIIYV